jgi:hypothetical protein
VEAEKPVMECIKLLYNNTTEFVILKPYVMESLANTLEEDTIEAVKICIQEHPYRLKNAFLHSGYRQQYREYEKPAGVQLNRVKLLSCCEQDPLVILVCMSSAIWRCVPVIRDLVKKTTPLIVQYVIGHSARIGVPNAEQLLHLVLERGFSLQDTPYEKDAFLTRMKGLDPSQLATFNELVTQVVDSLQKSSLLTDTTQSSLSPRSKA